MLRVCVADAGTAGGSRGCALHHVQRSVDVRELRAKQGKFIKCFENFEEGFVPLPPGIAILFDPLEGNVPNTDSLG
ncbi:MAG: hypothetical protein V3T53_10330, partial [Phycisphaerales bacterium]